MVYRKIAKKNTPRPDFLFVKNRPQIVHFIGIGGIGMSALAQWFLALSKVEGLAQKWVVSGSDAVGNEITQDLEKLGVRIKIGHKKTPIYGEQSRTIPRGCDIVVYSQAIRPENVELKEARRRHIVTVSYPEALGELSKFYTTICIAGAHGKSTTTAMTALILIKAGFDPTVIVGTKLKEFPSTDSTGSPQASSGQASNFRNGKSEWLILEADEYGRAFLNYSPRFTIVTNIDREHLDVYGNLKNIKKSFVDFFSRTENGGALILNRDSEMLFALKPAVEKIAHKRRLKVIWYSLYGDGSTSLTIQRSRTVKNPESKKIKKIIGIPGEHNISNALGAFYLSKVFKISEETTLRAIADYRGSWRRMEYRGYLHIAYSKEHIAKGRIHKPYAISHMPIYDDYAHHPTEIKATLHAFREKFPNKKIIAVFQPHQAERLRLLWDEFKTAFADADMTLIVPMYQVAGRDRVNPKYTSEKLVQAIQKQDPKKLIFYLDNPKNLKKALKTLLHSTFYILHSPLLVMMGAGDIVKYTDNLIA